MCDAGPHGQDAGVFLREKIHEFLHLRPGPDQGHVARDHIDQLRQFVQLVAAQEGPQWGDPIIVTGGDAGAAEVGIGMHGAEFVDAEDFPIQPDTVLTEEGGARAGQLDGERNEGKERGAADQTDPRSQIIKTPLQHDISV